MTVNAIESVVGDVFQAKQTTLGTIQPPADAGTKRLRFTGDSVLKAAKTYGMEEYVDGKVWGSPSMYVDQIGGEVGSLVCQAQISSAGFLFAQMIGSDTVTGTTPDYTHTVASGTARGPLQTYRIKTGASVGPWRNSWFDARISKLQLDVGQDQKVMHLTQDVMALKAANWYTADPTATDDGTDPYNWSEGVSAHTIDSGGGAVAFNEIDGETLTLDAKLDVHRGDSPAPVAYIFGKGEIDRSYSALMTDNTIPVIKSTLYNTTSPTDGLAVTANVQTVALESTYTRTAVRSLKITTGKVVVDPQDFEIGPKAEGGKIPITFGGRCQESSGVIITVVAKTADATAYV